LTSAPCGRNVIVAPSSGVPLTGTVTVTFFVGLRFAGPLSEQLAARATRTKTDGRPQRGCTFRIPKRVFMVFLAGVGPLALTERRVPAVSDKCTGRAPGARRLPHLPPTALRRPYRHSRAAAAAVQWPRCPPLILSCSRPSLAAQAAALQRSSAAPA